MSGVTQGIEDCEERPNGGYGSEQDGSGAERLATRDVEAGSAEGRYSSGQGLLHGWSSWLSRGRAGSKEVRRDWPPLVV